MVVEVILLDLFLCFDVVGFFRMAILTSVCVCVCVKFFYQICRPENSWLPIAWLTGWLKYTLPETNIAPENRPPQ